MAALAEVELPAATSREQPLRRLLLFGTYRKADSHRQDCRRSVGAR